MAALGPVTLDVRPATTADCRIVWEWANAPEVRAASFNSAQIPWESHVTWFHRRAADPANLFLLGVVENQPVGQIRFESCPEGAVVSFSLAPGQSGRGLGSALIRAGCTRWFARGGAGPIHAYTRPENARSIRALEKAGFACQPPVNLDRQLTCHLILFRDSP